MIQRTQQVLRGRTAIVTGASSGIGRAIAEQLGAAGAHVFLVGRRVEPMEATRSRIIGDGGDATVVQADVRSPAAVRGIVDRAVAETGTLNIMVNNAGVYQSKTFLEYEPQDFQRLLDVNLFGVIHLTQAALPAMQARGRGRIVNIASTAGKWGSRNQSAYNVSKHAVVGLTRCVAMETAASGVTVNAICPGFIQTDMVETLKAGYAAIGGPEHGEAVVKAALARVPMGRVLNPSEVAALAVYLGSNESAGMTGQSLLLDGGMLMC